MSTMFSVGSRHSWGTAAVAAVTSAVLGLAAATSAVANEPDTNATADDVTSAAPDAGAIVSPESIDGTLVASTDIGDVALPQSSAGDVVVASDLGGELSIGLPDVVNGAPAEVAEDGTVVYDGGAAVALTVQALESAVRATAVLRDTDAPTEYTYTYDGLTPSLNADGSVTLSVTGDGFTADVAQLDAPWAFDAEGRAVSTRYQVAGDTVTQIVDHRVAAYAYPIVADPNTQFDCGLISCTYRWNRATTRNIRDGAQLAGIVGGLASIGLGWSAGGAAAVMGVVAVFAGRYYEAGNCLGIRFYPAAVAVGIPEWFTVEVKRGTYNCA